LKISVVVDSAPFLKAGIPPDNAPQRTTITVVVAGRTVTADIATKTIRKVVRGLQEHGPENVVLVLQGALAMNNHLEEASIVAQVKAASAA
jgi:hypothetical protein